MSIARQYGCVPTHLARVDPTRAKRIRGMVAEAEQILRIGFDFQGRRFEGDPAQLAQARRSLIPYIRPFPAPGAEVAS